MLSEFVIVRRVWSRWTALVLAASFAACVDDTVTPAPEQPTAPAQPRVLGFVELTFSGIGTPELSSSMITAPTLEALQQLRTERDRSGDLRDLTTQDLTFPDSSGGGGNGTIQLSKDVGDQFAFDGVRYLHSTFFVRNAMVGGAEYDTERANLTFLAVSTNNTINQTALSKLELAGGTPAPPALALQVLPTDLMEQVGQTVSAAHPDVLQIFTESEIAAVAAAAPAGVTSVFPYGFVVRRVGPAGATTRSLPASPAESEFDGIVDFAFSIPQQANQADDPQQLSVLLLAVDDSETQVTQGPQEQGDTADIRALRQLAAGLGADTVTLLPGGALAGVSGLRTLCSVRTAGNPGSAAAYLVNVAGFQSFTPTPSSVIPDTAAFQATFTEAVFGIGPNSLTVRGSQSGQAFTDTTYSGNGSNTITTPQGSFIAGEQVEIALPDECPAPQLAHYSVQTDSATGGFSPQPDTSFDVGQDPRSIAIGDLNGDGSPDIVTANTAADSVSVLLNNNAEPGTFQPASSYGVGSGPFSVAIGDVNEDGSFDLAVANSDSHNVSVLLNNNDGSGTFQPDSTYGAGTNPQSVAIGDLNGDGSPDLATANNGSNDVSVLLNNNDGSGTFQPDTTYGAGTNPQSVAIGDLNGNGSLDLAIANNQSSNVSVLLNNNDGSGTFGPQTPFNAGDFPESVAIGDLNGDGNLDLAVASGEFFGNFASVLLNTGSGTFGPPQAHGSSNTGTAESVAIGDLNGDGRLDLATTNFSFGEVSVFLNNNDASNPFPPEEQRFGGGTAPYSIAISDLNGDGLLDLAIASLGDPGTVNVLFGQAAP